MPSGMGGPADQVEPCNAAPRGEQIDPSGAIVISDSENIGFFASKSSLRR